MEMTLEEACKLLDLYNNDQCLFAPSRLAAAKRVVNYRPKGAKNRDTLRDDPKYWKFKNPEKQFIFT